MHSCWAKECCPAKLKAACLLLVCRHLVRKSSTALVCKNAVSRGKLPCPAKVSHLNGHTLLLAFNSQLNCFLHAWNTVRT